MSEPIKAITTQLPGVAEFTPTGLRLRPGLSVEAYLELGRTLASIQTLSRVYLADYARGGVEMMGADGARECWRQLDLELGLALATQLEFSLGLPLLEGDMRPQGLTDEHFFIAAAECDGEAQQAYWLNVAREAGLNARQLQISIRAGEVRRAVSTPAGTRLRFGTIYQVSNAWRAFESVAKKPEEMSAEDIEAVIAELEPVVKYYEAVKGVAKGDADSVEVGPWLRWGDLLESHKREIAANTWQAGVVFQEKEYRFSAGKDGKPVLWDARAVKAQP